MSSTSCPACGAPTTPGARFCGRCGGPLQAPAASGGRGVWIASGLVSVAALVAAVVLLRQPRPAGPAGGTPDPAAFSGRAPDISTLTPRQAFDRLYDRVMAAAGQNDTATVLRFTAHALEAYGQLPEVDADARYHAAVLNAQVGQHAQALALADSILAAEPRHLFGHLVRGTVAALRGDSVALAAARRDFLSAWAIDPGTGRPEYLDHKSVLDEFHAAAAR